MLKTPNAICLRIFSLLGVGFAESNPVLICVCLCVHIYRVLFSVAVDDGLVCSGDFVGSAACSCLHFDALSCLICCVWEFHFIINFVRGSVARPSPRATRDEREYCKHSCDEIGKSFVLRCIQHKDVNKYSCVPRPDYLKLPQTTNRETKEELVRDLFFFLQFPAHSET